MDALAEKLDARLREWKPETAHRAPEGIKEPVVAPRLVREIVQIIPRISLRGAGVKPKERLKVNSGCNLYLVIDSIKPDWTASHLRHGNSAVHGFSESSSADTRVSPPLSPLSAAPLN